MRYIVFGIVFVCGLFAGLAGLAVTSMSDPTITKAKAEQLAAQAVAMDREALMEKIKATYDPNDDIYKFIPPAPKDWTDLFGDNERTRLIHAISELRVVVAAQGHVLMDMKGIDPNRVADPNN